MGHQSLVILPEPCIKAVFGHPVELSILKPCSVMFLQCDHQHSHPFIEVFGWLKSPLLQPSQCSIEVPEGGRCPVDDVHLLQYLGQSHVGSFTHGLKVIPGPTLQCRKHQLFNLLVVIALTDVLLDFSAPVTVGYCIFLWRVPEYRKHNLPVVPVPLLLGISFAVLMLFTVFHPVPLTFFICGGGMIGVV